MSQGKGVVVAVIDSGVNPAVSDLAGSVATGPDFTGVDTPPSDPNWGVHGTWMASLIAGHGHDGGDSGIIGSAPQSTVLSIRVITDASDPNYAKYEAQSASRGQRELAAAITYAVSHGAQVISMSLGYSLQSRPVRAALQYAYDHNVVVVASAGNSGDAAGRGRHRPRTVLVPGRLPRRARGRRREQQRPRVELLQREPLGAGGRAWRTGCRRRAATASTGTSAARVPACALTAGVVALIKAKYPALTDAQVISAITSSTTPTHTASARLGRADRLRRRRRRRRADSGRAPRGRAAAGERPWPRRRISAADLPRSRLFRSRRAGRPDSCCTACSAVGCLGLVAVGDEQAAGSARAAGGRASQPARSRPARRRAPRYACGGAIDGRAPRCAPSPQQPSGQ